MSILKMRDENGTIHSIAIMKGDKGDGVPDGGTTGQVIKKTADGTEWGDTGVPDGGSTGQVLKKTADGTAWGDVLQTNTNILSNTDSTVKSVSITQRGLYEVIGSLNSYDTYTFIMSVADLSKTVTKRQTTRYFIPSGTENAPLLKDELECKYENGEIKVSSTEQTYNASSGYIDYKKDRYHLSSVTLIIPYE